MEDDVCKISDGFSILTYVCSVFGKFSNVLTMSLTESLLASKTILSSAIEYVQRFCYLLIYQLIRNINRIKDFF